MPASDIATQLLGLREQGPLRSGLGSVLGLGYRLAGAHRQRVRLEHVQDTPLLVLPTVFNPRLLRTGAFFASVIAAEKLGAGGDVLDLGTGTGICAVFAARHARRVVAVDINRTAVCCAALNARLNQVEERVDCRYGDLFEPVTREHFDTVFFNPPFIAGQPANAQDHAWRSMDGATRFAAGLRTHLAPGGRAYLLLSTFGDACASFVHELARGGYALQSFATRRFINERVTVLEVRAGAGR
jgi:methylase of polypeptide subunit release factors